MKDSDRKLIATILTHIKGMVKALEIWLRERLTEDAKPPQEDDKTVI